MEKKIVIIGAGGFGREVLDVIEAIRQNGNGEYVPLGFVVDEKYGTPGKIINGLPILGGFDWLAKNSKKVLAICGVGAPQYRFQLIRRAIKVGCRFITLVHPSAILTQWINIGVGTVITAGCILTNQIEIGDHVHINLDCTIGHDAVLQDFATLAPGVHVSGKVFLGSGCYIGTGANILEKLKIGSWSIIGAGSTIIKDVPENVTVVGVPGKTIKVNNPGWHLEV